MESITYQLLFDYTRIIVTRQQFLQFDCKPYSLRFQIRVFFLPLGRDSDCSVLLFLLETLLCNSCPESLLPFSVLLEFLLFSLADFLVLVFLLLSSLLTLITSLSTGSFFQFRTISLFFIIHSGHRMYTLFSALK